MRSSNIKSLAGSRGKLIRAGRMAEGRGIKLTFHRDDQGIWLMLHVAPALATDSLLRAIVAAVNDRLEEARDLSALAP